MGTSGTIFLSQLQHLNVNVGLYRDELIYLLIKQALSQSPFVQQGWAEFWALPHQRMCRTSHSQQRPRLNRSAQSDRAPIALDRRSLTSVSFQVRNFQLCGELRRTKTEVRNSLPTQNSGFEVKPLSNSFLEKA